MYFICYRARNDDLVERMNGKMKKTEDTVETVSSKIKLLEGEQEKMTSTIGGHKEIFLFKKHIQDRCRAGRATERYIHIDILNILMRFHSKTNIQKRLAKLVSA